MEPGFAATQSLSPGEIPPKTPASFLTETAFFDPLPDWARQELAHAAESRSLAAGDFIVAQHDKATHACFLKSGVAQVLLKFDGADDLVIESLTEPGSVIGWSVFRPPYRYTASIRCETPCEIVLVPRSAFRSVFRQDPGLEYPLLQRAAQVVANRLAHTQSLLITRPVPKTELEPRAEREPKVEHIS